MREELLPEDAALRSLYDARPPGDLWSRISAAGRAERSRRWPRRLADPAHRRHVRPLLAALAISVCAGLVGGVYGLGVVHRSSGPSGGAATSTSTPCSQPASLSTSPTPVASPTGDSSAAATPDSSLSESQRQAEVQQRRQEWEQRYVAWLNALDLSHLNWHSLARYPLLEEPTPEEPTLHLAVERADLIVSGCVSAINPTPFNGTDTTFVVDQTIKGHSMSSVALKQSGGLRPTPDWKGVTIGDAPNGALLLPGDRAVLLLEKERGSDQYEIQSYSGWYQVVDGSLRTTTLHSWWSSYDGVSESAFIEVLRAAVRRK